VVSKRWNLPELDIERLGGLQRETRCSPTVAALLMRRGLSRPQDAQRFLEPKLPDLSEPQTLPDIEPAVERITRAIERRERVTIFGDYDVDGVSSTCLMLDFFHIVEFPVHHRLPHRQRDGYGLHTNAVRELADEGTELIITVDNGSASRVEIEVARDLGIDVVVIDHHQPSRPIPEPVAFVNPWLREESNGFRAFAGVGVTFKVVWALCQHFSRAKKLSPSFRDFLVDSMALVALGTVSDVVPLLDENRVMTKFGLRALESSRRPGLRKLVEICLPPGETRQDLEASHIGFRIGPRLNAAGRLGDAGDAVDLLRAQNDEEAERLLEKLENENRRRRSIEADILADARRRVHEDFDLDRDRCIVLADDSWHPGVIGIVAARLVEEFFRPTLLFAITGDRGRGSARSIPGVDIHAALSSSQVHLLKFGGHALAAGAEVEVDKLDDLRDALNAAIDLPPCEMIPEIDVDCRLSLDEVTSGLLDEISRLSPFGEGNPEPLFAATDVEIAGQPRVMGANGKHLAFHVREPGSNNKAFRAVAFGMGALYPLIERRGTRVSILYRPQWNEWQGRRSIELRVTDLRTTRDP